MAKSTGPKKKRAARKRETANVGGRERSAVAESAATSARQTGSFLPAKAGLVLQRWYRPGSTGQPQMSEALSGELRLAKMVSEGFPTKAVDDVIEAGLVEARVLYDIVLPRRTLADRKQKDKPLSPDQSDRLARVLRVYARAEDAIGDVTRAFRWLHKENRALGGERPIELLGSDAGARAVERVLGRIEHGIVS